VAVSSPDVDGIIIGSRTVNTCRSGILPELEAAAGKPVISAMQAFIWDTMNVAGIAGEINKAEGFGSLLHQS